MLVLPDAPVYSGMLSSLIALVGAPPMREQVPTAAVAYDKSHRMHPNLEVYHPTRHEQRIHEELDQILCQLPTHGRIDWAHQQTWGVCSGIG